MINEYAAKAYPLSWPIGWKRTERRSRSRYGDRSIAQARDEVERQLRLLGARAVVISSNLALRQDGLPRSGQSQPADPGVAVYFTRKGRNICFAADSYSAVEDNLWSVAVTIDSIRRIERAGSAELLDRAFVGFPALPAPEAAQAEPWHKVLGVFPQDEADTVRNAYRLALKDSHPDMTGGSREKYERVRAAWESFKAERGIA